MAVKEWWFPSSTGNWKSPGGDYRIRIWYNDSSSYSKDMLSGIKRLADLHIPLENDPSGQQFRHAYLKIELENHNDEFETESLLNVSKKNETFIDLYRNGTLFWTGLLDWRRVEKKDWHFVGGVPKYREVSMYFVDRLAYFWKNDKTLADISYDKNTPINELFINLKDLISINNLNFDSNLEIVEWENISGVGDKKYKIRDLYINRQDSNMLISEWLKNLIVAIGAFAYTLHDTLYVTRRNMGSIQAILNDDVLRLDVVQNPRTIQYVKVSATLDMNKDTTEFHEYFLIPTITVINENHEQGTPSQDGSKDVVIDATGILDEIHSQWSSTYLFGPFTADNLTANALFDSGQTFLYNNVESGDGIDMDFSGSNYLKHSMIRKMSDQENLFFQDIGSAPGNFQYRIERGAGPADDVSIKRRYKIYLLTLLAKDIYADYFLTTDEITRVRLKDIATHQNIHLRYDLNSLNHRVKNARMRLERDEIDFEFVRVS